MSLLSKSIKYKIIGTTLLIVGVLLTVLIYTLSVKLGSIVNKSMEENYKIRINTILDVMKEKEYFIVENELGEQFRKGVERTTIKTLTEISKSESNSAFIPSFIDKEGKVMYSPDELKLSLPIWAKSITKSSAATELYYSVDNQKYWVVHNTFEPWGLVVAYAVLESEKNKEQYSLIIYLLSIGIVGLILVSFVIYVVLSWLLKPLLDVNRVMKEIAEGHIDDAGVLEVNAVDEIGDLARSFNRMIGALKSSTVSIGRLENEIEQRKVIEEKLKNSNEELTDFAYIASHDLQEPLRKVSSFGERVIQKNKDILDDTSVDYLNRMMNASARMRELILGLLQFSRITTQAKPFEKIDFNIIAKEVLEDLEIRVHESGGKVEIGDLPQVYADPLQIRQLFQNVIGNALKYHREGVPPVVTIRSEERDGRVFIYIKDNGIGFEQKHADKVFGVFQRLVTRNKFEGTGVGLAVCKKIVKRHRGDIRALSEPDKGTEFIIELPLTQNVNSA